MKMKLYGTAAAVSWFLAYGVIGALESTTEPVTAGSLFPLACLLLVFGNTARYAFYRPRQRTRCPKPAPNCPAGRKAA